MSLPGKLFNEHDGQWVEHSHPPLFVIEPTSAGTERVIAGLPGADACDLFGLMADQLTPPYSLLYVLHTPRGEADAGRYQSPDIDRQDLRAFLKRFAGFLTADGRFDLWLFSAEDSATVVWDRHNRLFAYGPVDRYAAALRASGFETGRPSLDFPHTHHYRPECDADAAALLGYYDWWRTPLQPQDED